MSSASVPKRSDLLEQASAMVPLLRSRALETERNRSIGLQTHRAFLQNGFYRVFQPKRYGGYEMPINMLVELGSELARGCGSSAWIFTNLATQNWIIGMHQPAAQDDVWGTDRDALCASSFPTQGGTGRYVDGGIVLDGMWSFASGIDFADWENLQVFIPKEGGPPDHRFVLVSKRDFTIHDDWFVNGLCGTGSKSVILKDVFVPEHRVLNSQLIYGGPSPGSEVNPDRYYKVPPLSVGTKVFSGVALGLARGALELIIDEMSDRNSVGRVKMSELPTVQIRVAEASAEIDAAEALLLKDCDDAMRMGAEGQKPQIADASAVASQQRVCRTALLARHRTAASPDRGEGAQIGQPFPAGMARHPCRRVADHDGVGHSGGQRWTRTVWLARAGSAPVARYA